MTRYSTRGQVTQPGPINFTIWLQLHLGHQLLVFASTTNLKSGPHFAVISFLFKILLNHKPFSGILCNDIIACFFLFSLFFLFLSFPVPSAMLRIDTPPTLLLFLRGCPPSTRLKQIWSCSKIRWVVHSIPTEWQYEKFSLKI